MDNELETLIKVIGSIVLALFVVAIPVFCGLAYGINMDFLIKLLLTMVTIAEAAIVWVAIWGTIGR